MKPALIPTPIVDKNGKQTTVHKAVPTPAATAQTIPAPAPYNLSATRSPLDRTITRLDKSFGNWKINLPRRIDRDSIVTQLAALPEDLQQRIWDSAERHVDDYHFDAMIISALHMKRTPTTVDDCLYFYDHTSDMKMAVINDDWSEHGYDVEYSIVGKFDWVRKYNERLTGYSFRFGGTRTPLREHDPKTRAQVVALIDFTNFFAETGQLSTGDALYMTPEPTLQITDTDLAQLIVDHPEYSEKIRSIMIERKTLDPELIRGVLENSAQAMNDGVL